MTVPACMPHMGIHIKRMHLLVQDGGIHVYVHKPGKVIILDVKTSLLSLRSLYMPTQLILSYFHGFVILIKFYRFITLYNTMPTNASC